MLQLAVATIALLFITSSSGIQEGGAKGTSDIEFWLWTSQNPTEAQVILADAGSIETSSFDPTNPTILFAHGFADGADFAVRYGMIPNYFSVGDYNLISIQWDKMAACCDYFGSVESTKIVGEFSASIVQVLLNSGATMDQFHLIGHSLGAHVMGFLGKQVKLMDIGKIPRITGLDPAMPGFDFAGEEDRLHKNDADFVDIIHTNSGFIWEGCLSMHSPIGHVDHYPAGGKHQPGCTEICVEGECTENDLIDMILGGCSHSRSIQYYAESITAGQDQRFIGWRCHNNWGDFQKCQSCDSVDKNWLMGAWTEPGAPFGQYFMMVGEEEPFAMDINGNFCN